MANSPSKKTGSSQIMSYVFVFFIVLSVLFAAFATEEPTLEQLKKLSDLPGALDAKSRMQAVSVASFAATKNAVNLAIGLIGMMAFWLGLFKILEVGGFLKTIALKLKPILSRLFPDIPPDHPAMGAMVMNMSANMFGFGNAATPFGLKAMQELEKLNPFKGTATNAMIMFLAINTSNIALLPLGVIGLRVSAGAGDPAGIILPSLCATACSTIFAITIALFLAKKDSAYRQEYAEAIKEKADELARIEKEDDVKVSENEKFLTEPTCISRSFAIIFLFTLLAAFLYRLFIPLFTGQIEGTFSNSVLNFLRLEFASFWLLPTLMILIISYAFYNGIRIYDTIVDGAKQGFELAVRIIPFLVVILVAVGMFRASGAMDAFIWLLSPLTDLIGMPADVLPMAVIRPLSGSGAFSVLSSIVAQDANSYSSFLASVLNGSSETTFYVLAVYFGSVGIYKIRHAVIAALACYVIGVLAACFFSKIFY